MGSDGRHSDTASQGEPQPAFQLENTRFGISPLLDNYSSVVTSRVYQLQFSIVSESDK